MNSATVYTCWRDRFYGLARPFLRRWRDRFYDRSATVYSEKQVRFPQVRGMPRRDRFYVLRIRLAACPRGGVPRTILRTTSRTTRVRSPGEEGAPPRQGIGRWELFERDGWKEPLLWQKDRRPGAIPISDHPPSNTSVGVFGEDSACSLHGSVVER